MKREERGVFMKSVTKKILDWVIIIVVAFAINFVLRTFLISNIVIPSPSMVPTINVGDRMFVSQIFNVDKLEYGDIIVFHPPVKGEEEKQYIKRFIGKEGDIIQVKDGALYRNGEKISEPYIAEKMNYEFGPVTIPKGKVFVMGDNRNDSYDSHLWDEPFLDKKEITGLAGFRFYPFNRMGTMK